MEKEKIVLVVVAAIAALVPLIWWRAREATMTVEWVQSAVGIENPWDRRWLWIKAFFGF